MFTCVQIDAKFDRFSSKATLALKPQIIREKPDHFMTLTIKTQVSKSDRPGLKVSLFSKLYVVSQVMTPPDFGDNELHFLVDNKPLEISYLTLGDIPFDLESKYSSRFGVHPVLSDSDLDNKRRVNLRGVLHRGFHNLAGFFDLLLRDLEDQLVVNLQDHSRLQFFAA